MERTTLTTRSGLAAVLAGVLLLASDVLELAVFGFVDVGQIAPTGAYVFITGLILLAALLFLLGLVGLYASQLEAAGSLGLLGFLVAFAGTALFAGFFWAQEFFAPAAAEVAPGLLDNGPGWLAFGSAASFFLFALGWLLFGVATFRARVYPRWAAVLLMVGAVLTIFPTPVPTFVFDVAVVWMGLVLSTGRAHRSIDPLSEEPGNAPEGG